MQTDFLPAKEQDWRDLMTAWSWIFHRNSQPTELRRQQGVVGLSGEIIIWDSFVGNKTIVPFRLMILSREMQRIIVFGQDIF